MISHHSIIPCLCMLVLVSVRPLNAEDLPNTLGWQWRVPPHEPASFFASRGFLLISETSVSGNFAVTLARPMSGEKYQGLQIVAFNEKKQPFRLEPRSGGGQNGMSLQRWVLPKEDLPPSKVVHVGVEILTRESVERATQDAVRAAELANVEVLPFPVVGQPYSFRLTDTLGQPCATSEFAGDVLIIDCWATWCASCVAKLPSLKELQSRYNDQGLQILGVNFDESSHAGKEFVAQHNLDWRSVYVPSDEQTRDLWHAANGIMALPRILVIDREGKLRADMQAFDGDQLERLVERLLEERN